MTEGIFRTEDDRELALAFVDAARKFGVHDVDSEMLRRLEAVASRAEPVDSYTPWEQDDMAAALRLLSKSLENKVGMEAVFADDVADDAQENRLTVQPSPPTPVSEPPFDRSHATPLALVQHERKRAVRLSGVIGESVDGIPYRAFVRNHVDTIAGLLAGFIDHSQGRPRVVSPEEAEKTAMRAGQDLDAVDVLSRAGLEVMRTYAGGVTTDITFLLYQKKIRHGDLIHSISKRLQDAIAAGDQNTAAFSLMEYEIRKNALLEPLPRAREEMHIDDMALTKKVNDLIRQSIRIVAQDKGYDFVSKHLQCRIAQLRKIGTSDCTPKQAWSLISTVDHDVDRLMAILQTKEDEEEVWDRIAEECRDEALSVLRLIESQGVVSQERGHIEGSIKNIKCAIAFEMFDHVREGLAELHVRTSQIMRPYGPLTQAPQVGGGSGGRVSGLSISQLPQATLAFQSGAFLLGMSSRFAI